MTQDTKQEIRIVVQSEGFVSVGYYAREGLYARITWGAHVRRYGGVETGQVTDSRGLGKLAEIGPSGDTILDWKPPSEHHLLSEVETIACDQAVWSSICAEHGKDPADFGHADWGPFLGKKGRKRKRA